MTDIFGHTVALLGARKDAKKDLRSKCQKLHGSKVCSKKNLRIEKFRAHSGSSYECGASITPRCEFGHATYIGSLKSQDRIKNMILKKEILEEVDRKCFVVYGQVRAWKRIKFQVTYGAVLDPVFEADGLYGFKISDYREVISGSEFKGCIRFIQTWEGMSKKEAADISFSSACELLFEKVELKLREQFDFDYEKVDEHKVLYSNYYL